MEVEVRNLSGEKVGQMELDDRVFGIEPNRAVVHQVVVAQLANLRQGTADTRTRAQVSGGGSKPWRQKGTGRARQGSRRAPHWRGGGIAFGPHPRSYRQAVPRKVRRLALRSSLSDKVTTGELMVVDRFVVDDGRTKTLIQILGALGVEGKVIIVLSERDKVVRRASGNLPNVHVALPNGLSLLDLLNADVVLFSREAVQPVTDLLLAEAAVAA